MDGYQILLEGRADGVIESPTETVIDEIKAVYMDLRLLEEPVPVHLAQALCYAYMYGCSHNLERIGIQLTYCSMRQRRFGVFARTEPGRNWRSGLRD